MIYDSLLTSWFDLKSFWFFKLIIPDLVCGGHFNGDAGEIDYPLGDMTNYAHNQSCSYVITTSANKVINITFLEFHLEGSRDHCRYDWLQIHDGRDSTARIIGRFCGTQSPPNFVSTTNRVYMWMRTDHSVSHAGIVYHALISESIEIFFFHNKYLLKIQIAIYNFCSE